MNTDELFVDAHKLPKPLSEEELHRLLQHAKEGSKEARDKLITQNIKLVLYEVTSKFKNVVYDKKDLVSIGNVGLVKAIDTYEASKGIKFSTYAIRCIDNEILMFLRKLKRYNNVDSLDRVVFHNKHGDGTKLEDQITDDTDLVEDNETIETHKIIREVVKNLPERDREIIMLRFGFYNDRIYKYREIAEKMNITRSYVQKLIDRTVKKIGKILESEGVIELHSNARKEKKEEMPKLQTIYEYFKNYTKEQVDEMLTKLTEEEKSLVKIRYGEDLNHSVATKLTKEQRDKFYGTLVPKMKRLLSNPMAERKPRQKKEKIQQQSIIEQTTNREPEYDDKNSHESIEFEDKTTQVSSIAIQEKVEQPAQVEELVTEKEQTTSHNKEMTKEECLKILELLRTPSFAQMMNTLSVKEAVIISLKLGYIDGKYFSTESISEFLGIEPSEVIETTKKVLLLYKDHINSFLDNAIAIATDEVVKDRTLSMNSSFIQK